MNSVTRTAAAPGVSGYDLVWPLVRKDWSFVKGPMLAYLATGLLAVGLLAVENRFALIVGVSLLISAIVIIGVHFIFGTVINERSKQTLPFIMSLPITYGHYSLAKLVSCLGGFTIAWGLIVLTLLAVIGADNHLPPGLAPYAVMVLLELFAAFAVTLAVAMVFESEVWTIVTMTVLNVGISIFMNVVGSLQGVAAHIEGPVPVWNGTVLGIITAELVVILGAVAAALLLQLRKSDFL
ncbi:MAG: ABC-2 transporter permease [Pseudomonadota bacterium]